MGAILGGFGIFAYYKSKSKISLIAGLAFGTAYLYSGYLIKQGIFQSINLILLFELFHSF